MKIIKYFMICTIVGAMLLLVSCFPQQVKVCNHEWKAATCTEARTCALCFETQGEPQGHSGGEATCIDKAVCSVCNDTYGEVDSENHSADIEWKKTANAHYEAYSCCGEKVSEAENHIKVNGVCSICGFNPVVGVSSVEYSADNQTATVIISIADNPGILGLEMSVTFDTNALALVETKSGSAMSGFTFTAPDDFSNGGKFLWDGMNPSTNNGEVLILTFDISNATAGSYSMLIKASSYDSELNHLSFRIENGNINVD